MQSTRYSLDELLNSTIEPPKSLDYLEFEFKGITIRCFGILHGITGGLNRDYREFIKDSIRNTIGIKLAEKGMKQLYPHCGIDKELEDWLVLRPIDCLVMGFQLLADPRCLWMITIDALCEKFRQRDAFVDNKRKYIHELGESRFFHYLDEFERREIAGFLPSPQAIANDLSSLSQWNKVILPKQRHEIIQHSQWKRLLLLERVMHIPCRSIHMLHYATAYAKHNNHKLVNLFVGETHNTDMQFLATHSEQFTSSLNDSQKSVMKKIIKRAEEIGGSSSVFTHVKLLFNKIRYLILLLLGVMIPAVLYLFIYHLIKS